jgi:hypothetical protein
MAQQQGKRSFAQTLATGVGDGYIISSGQLLQLNPGDALIVMDKDTQQCAQGTMVALQPNGWALNGRQRYDVLMRNMAMVPFQNVPLERWGVSVI